MNSDRITDFAAAAVQQSIQRPVSGTSRSGSNDVSFRQTLEKEKQSESLSFSRHAAERLDQRGISVSDGLMSDLEQAVSKAREKGSKEVAVIGSEGIFIVNVPNNVVVTTMTQDDMKDRILTNIDGAVIMQGKR
ncbi:MAG: TIGR02530 family flagellar biosynthesis protein [Eubacteriales bacterium]|jgi:flagellar operon protein